MAASSVFMMWLSTINRSTAISVSMAFTTSILGNHFSLISTVAARMLDSCAMAATANPTSISTSSANAPDRRVEIFKFFMNSL